MSYQADLVAASEALQLAHARAEQDGNARHAEILKRMGGDVWILLADAVLKRGDLAEPAEKVVVDVDVVEGQS